MGLPMEVPMEFRWALGSDGASDGTSDGSSDGGPMGPGFRWEFRWDFRWKLRWEFRWKMFPEPNPCCVSMPLVPLARAVSVPSADQSSVPEGRTKDSTQRLPLLDALQRGVRG